MTLYEPAKARAKLPKDLEAENLIAEEKFDGSRYLLYIGHDPYDEEWKGNTLLSRRKSVKKERLGMYVDKSANIPHITEHKFKGLEYTVLDGEVTIPGQPFYTLNGIMNSLPTEAIRKQMTEGKVVYHVFDILQYRGVDLTGDPLVARREHLDTFFGKMSLSMGKWIKRVESRSERFQEYFDFIVRAKGEGLIIKDLWAAYGKGWSKMKKAFDTTCVVMGYKEGTGKYKGQMGALQLGVYFLGGLVEVGFASGMDDSLRLEISNNPNYYLNLVVDVYAQELTPGEPVGRLRHPTFHRFRNDVSEEDCTYEKLQEDFELEKAKGERHRGDIKGTAADELRKLASGDDS